MKRQMDHRGLSLIELIVSIAILSIVVGAIFGFFLFSMRSYNKDSGETNVQREAQMTVNRLQNQIVNTTTGIGKDDAEMLSAVHRLYLYTRVMQKDGNVQRRKITIYQQDHSLMYGYSYDVVDENDQVIAGMVGTVADTEIADYVRNFYVDLTKLETDQQVTVHLEFEDQKKSYATDNTISLRNQLTDVISANAADYFK